LPGCQTMGYRRRRHGLLAPSVPSGRREECVDPAGESPQVVLGLPAGRVCNLAFSKQARHGGMGGRMYARRRAGIRAVGGVRRLPPRRDATRPIYDQQTTLDARR
jgi:hypothetical protein